MRWNELAAYALCALLGAAGGWSVAKVLRRDLRWELTSGLMIVGLLIAGTVVMPRVRAHNQLAALRDAGRAQFGDTGAGELYAQRLVPIVSDPKLDERLQALAARMPGLPHGLAAATYAGMARLSTEELEDQLALRRQLAAGSPSICAALWRGGVAPEDLTTGLRALPLPQQERWIELNARAAALELAATSPVPAVSFATVGMAWSTLFALLPPADRALLEDTAKRGPKAPADDACRAFKLFAAEVGRLPPTARDTLVRTVTSPFLTSSP